MAPTAEEHELDAEASRLMKQGMALASHATLSSLAEAISCFDRAIALRERLPLHATPEHRCGLAAGWLNRAEALTARGSDIDLEDAVRAYDAALALLGELPLDVDPRVRRRLVIAWQNRGLVLQRQASEHPPAAAEAVRCLRHAVTLIDDEAATAISDHARIRVTVWANLASVLTSVGTVAAMTEARAAADQVLGSLDNDALDRDESAATVFLSAQHVLCRATGRLLEADSVFGDERRALFEKASDAVDDALALARRWEAKGVDRFRPLAADLVRFGCRVYAMHQPQFLNEFVLENLDPSQSSGAFVASPDMRAAALESLWLSFRRPGRV